MFIKAILLKGLWPILLKGLWPVVMAVVFYVIGSVTFHRFVGMDTDRDERVIDNVFFVIAFALSVSLMYHFGWWP
jgi:hypothetical protein